MRNKQRKIRNQDIKKRYLLYLRGRIRALTKKAPIKNHDSMANLAREYKLTRGAIHHIVYETKTS